MVVVIDLNWQMLLVDDVLILFHRLLNLATCPSQRWLLNIVFRIHGLLLILLLLTILV